MLGTITCSKWSTPGQPQAQCHALSTLITSHLSVTVQMSFLGCLRMGWLSLSLHSALHWLPVRPSPQSTAAPLTLSGWNIEAKTRPLFFNVSTSSAEYVTTKITKQQGGCRSAIPGKFAGIPPPTLEYRTVYFLLVVCWVFKPRRNFLAANWKNKKKTLSRSIIIKGPKVFLFPFIILSWVNSVHIFFHSQ